MSVAHETFTYTDDEARLDAFRYDEAIESAWKQAHRGRVPDLESYYRAVKALRVMFRIGEYEASEGEPTAQERGWKTQRERMAGLGCVALDATVKPGDKVFYYRSLFVVKSIRPLESHEISHNRTVEIAIARTDGDGKEPQTLVVKR